ncbi:MocR-like pyridoxine biosynthesis transcription factor PdxR [Sinomonas soli]
MGKSAAGGRAEDQYAGHGFALGDPAVGETLTVRVRRTIEQFVARGVWAAGTRVPSSRRLAADLGISRSTVQNAYMALIDEGYLVTQDRKGVFVSGALAAAGPQQPYMTSEAARRMWEEGVDWERVTYSPRAPWPELERERLWYTYRYPFVTGQHDPAFFPREAWLRALRRALEAPHRHASLDDTLADDECLVQAIITQLLPTRGLTVDPENVLITLGSQQGLQLIAETTVRRGDRVAVENPGYIDARHVFNRSGARIVDVPVDENGVIPQGDYDGARLLFVTPSHQHPTNVTLSLERRLSLINQAEEQDFLIVEDDYDSELRYRGRPSPSMASLDPRGRTVYLGTLSKVLAPGLRVGYVVGPRALIAALRDRRRYAHRQPPGHLQRAVGLLLESGDFARSQRQYRNALARRWEIASHAARRDFPPGQVLPPGGTGLWLRLPNGMDARTLAVEARRHSILIDPGNMYFSDPDVHSTHIRVGFGAIPESLIDTGIRRLSKLMRDHYS